MMTKQYKKEILVWRKQRLIDVSDPEGYLSVVGTYWLEEGENSFGSSNDMDCVLKGEGIPGFCGYFIKNGDKISVKLKAGLGITINGNPAGNEEIKMISDVLYNDRTILGVASIRLHVMDRGYQFGIRIKDLNRPEIKAFSGLDFYDINESWVVHCAFELQQEKQHHVTDVHGLTRSFSSRATFKFERDGMQHELVTFDPPEYLMEEAGLDDKDVAVMFFDLSDEKHFRYVMARFENNSEAILDFNKAHSPPCAFTPHVPCAMPPPQNRLKIAVTAGEAYYVQK